MGKLIKGKELGVGVKRILYDIMAEKAEYYNMMDNIIDKKLKGKADDDVIELYNEFLTQAVEVVYVLLNTVDFQGVYFWYTEDKFRSDLNDSFKEVNIPKDRYAGIVGLLINAYNDTLAEIMSRDRRIKKTDSEEVANAIKINRKVIKMVEKKIDALEEYYELLKSRV